MKCRLMKTSLMVTIYIFIELKAGLSYCDLMIVKSVHSNLQHQPPSCYRRRHIRQGKSKGLCLFLTYCFWNSLKMSLKYCSIALTFLSLYFSHHCFYFLISKCWPFFILSLFSFISLSVITKVLNGLLCDFRTASASYFSLLLYNLATFSKSID